MKYGGAEGRRLKTATLVFHHVRGTFMSWKLDGLMDPRGAVS